MILLGSVPVAARLVVATMVREVPEATSVLAKKKDANFFSPVQTLAMATDLAVPVPGGTGGSGTHISY